MTSESDTSGKTTAGPSWARRLPLLVSLAVCAITAIVLGALYVRGTWTDAAPRDPSSSSEGVVSQLCRADDGRPYVRSAAVIDAPAARIWSTVTDYRRFPEIFHDLGTFATLRIDSSAVEPDGRTRLTGEVSSALGMWPIDARVTHATSPDRYEASWNEQSPEFDNRGSWTVTALGPDRSLVVYRLDVRATNYPAFLVNAVLLNGVSPVVEAVRADAGRADR